MDMNRNGFLEREDLLSIAELNVNPLGDRIIHAFFSENQTVKETERLRFQVKQIFLLLCIFRKKCLFQDFAHVLAKFRPCNKNDTIKLNSKRDKLLFSFRMYDLDGDGQISKVRKVLILSPINYCLKFICYESDQIVLG